MSVFDTSNQLAINALAAARENVKLYGKAMESIMEYNNNISNAWSSFFTSAQSNTLDSKIHHSSHQHKALL